MSLAYKVVWADSTLVAVDRFYPSSKTCSACGTVKAKLLLSERVFACDACGHEQNRDLNAALNLADIAQQFAQAEGSQCHVAAAGAETKNARGGHVRPAPWSRQRSLKREDPQGVIPASRGAGIACRVITLRGDRSTIVHLMGREQFGAAQDRPAAQFAAVQARA